MSQQRSDSGYLPYGSAPLAANACAAQKPSAQARGPRRGSVRVGLRIGRLVAAGLGLLAVWACGPVYIPVPPPDEISFRAQLFTEPSGATRTMWIASGGPNANAADATFFVTDLERGAGVIARAQHDGSFTSGPMDGSPGDHVSVYYRDLTGRDSVPSCVLLADAQVADHCP
jgi:hypothetical protein